MFLGEQYNNKCFRGITISFMEVSKLRLTSLQEQIACCSVPWQVPVELPLLELALASAIFKLIFKYFTAIGHYYYYVNS